MAFPTSGRIRFHVFQICTNFERVYLGQICHNSSSTLEKLQPVTTEGKREIRLNTPVKSGVSLDEYGWLFVVCRMNDCFISKSKCPCVTISMFRQPLLLLNCSACVAQPSGAGETLTASIDLTMKDVICCKTQSFYVSPPINDTEAEQCMSV